MATPAVKKDPIVALSESTPIVVKAGVAISLIVIFVSWVVVKIFTIESNQAQIQLQLAEISKSYLSLQNDYKAADSSIKIEVTAQEIRLNSNITNLKDNVDKQFVSQKDTIDKIYTEVKDINNFIRSK